MVTKTQQRNPIMKPSAAETKLEEELRGRPSPWPKSKEELEGYIAELMALPRGYGSCVYAASLAAVAAFNYVSGVLGMTGFQASLADLDILRRTRDWDRGRLLDYRHLLYPQYCDEESFPSLATLLAQNRIWLAEEANKLLAKEPVAAKPVLAHWKWLASQAKKEKP